MRFSLLLVLLSLSVQGSSSVVIDGVLAPTEPAGATTLTLSNGGVVHLRRLDDHIYVALQSPAAGFGNVCVANDRRVRILHASAALGDAEYERADATWRKRTGFTWVLRDSPRLPKPTDDQKRAHLADRGWLGHASFEATLVREFLIRISPDDRYVAVSFVETSRVNTVAFAPDQARDDCTRGDVAVGFLPETASFTPTTWLSVAAIGR